jgi:hypothetical protein
MVHLLLCFRPDAACVPTEREIMDNFQHPIRTLASLTAALLVVACSGPVDPNPGATPTIFRVDVLVESRGNGTETRPLDDATVTLSRPGTPDAVGTVDLASGHGLYRLHAFLDDETPPDHLLLTVTAPGHAPQYRRVPPVTLKDDEVTPLLIPVVLLPREPFEVANFLRLGMLDERVTVSHPPEEVATGTTRLFHPELDVLGLPGPMQDSLGRFLGTGVFASVTLEDQSGGTISQLDGLATLRMQLPRGMWPSIVAIEPGDQFIEPGDQFIEPGDQFIEPGDQFRGAGSDPIQVPIYGYDTGTGNWSLASLGHLVGASGVPLALDDLADLWAGAYPASVFVQAEVSHFSYWGYAWPTAGEACLSGRIEDADGTPTAGVTITATGVGQPFVSDPVVSGDDGHFCLAVPRVSPTRGYGLRLSAGLGTSLTDLGTVVVEGSEGTATCGLDGCQDIGAHRLPSGVTGRSESAGTSPSGDPAPEDDVGYHLGDSEMYLCETRLRTLLHGNAVGDVEVHARLPHAPPSVVSWCRDGCVLSGKSDEYGELAFSFPHDEIVEISLHYEEDLVRELRIHTGLHRLDRCPDAEVHPVALQESREQLDLNVYLDAADARFTWTPERPAYLIEVRTADGKLKWAAGGDGPDARFYRIGYGEVLHEAPTLYPRTGEPAELEAGDVVHVYVAATLEMQSSGSGTLVIAADGDE